MSLFKKLLGRPLPSPVGERKELSVATGVPALGLDAVASIAYGPEAALTILLPLGAGGLSYFLPITIAIIFLLLILYLSYRQTLAAYPNGGGAYNVASDNFGKSVGIWAAFALLADYILNVAVGISAGVGAIISAIPGLQTYKLTLCLIVLITLTIINLRGVSSTGRIFLIPLILFVLCLGSTVLIALYKLYQNMPGHPIPVIIPPPIPEATEKLSYWLLLAAFASGLTAMTGIEAVSNAVPIFRKPIVQNAQRTLGVIVLILGFFLLALAILGPAYQIGAIDERKPGYQSILSQFVGAVVGHGIFYYISIASIFTILLYSAQTSFVAFPRVCRFLAQDGYMPHFFADRGRRLVYSHGILILAVISGILLVIFHGITNLLIPLFAVGAFSAFLFSQTGMIAHWCKRGAKANWIKLMVNVIGAFFTAIALLIIITEKFLHGAWIIILFAPFVIFLFHVIHGHYQKIARAIEKPLSPDKHEVKKLMVIIPIDALNQIAEKALNHALLISNEIIAVHVRILKEEDEKKLRQLWQEKIKNLKEHKKCSMRLEIIQSPYRRINQPIIDFVKKTRKENPDHIIAVIIPELVEPRWYEYLLHNTHAEVLRALLLLERDDNIIVISIPWYLHKKRFAK